MDTMALRRRAHLDPDLTAAVEAPVATRSNQRGPRGNCRECGRRSYLSLDDRCAECAYPVRRLADAVGRTTAAWALGISTAELAAYRTPGAEVPPDVDALAARLARDPARVIRDAEVPGPSEAAELVLATSPGADAADYPAPTGPIGPVGHVPEDTPARRRQRKRAWAAGAFASPRGRV